MATIIEAYQADLVKYDTQLNDKVAEYNKGKDENLPIREIEKLKEEADELLKQYNKTAKNIAYEQFKADPEGTMIAACRACTYPAQKITESSLDDSDDKRLVIEPAARKIDLGDLHKKVKGIGVDTNWIHAIQQLNCMMTVKTAADFGMSGEDITKIRSSFRMEKLARAYDLGENPCGQKKLLETLQKIVGMMIGEDGYQGRKAMSWDVKFLQHCWGKQSNKALLKVKAATNRQMYSYIMVICHRIIVDGMYGVDYQEIKEK